MGSRLTTIENRHKNPVKIIFTHPCRRNSQFHLDVNGTKTVKSKRGNITVSVFETEDAPRPYSMLTTEAGTTICIESNNAECPEVDNSNSIETRMLLFSFVRIFTDRVLDHC